MNGQIISTEFPVVKPCIKCGARDRKASGGCKPCAREAVRKWRELNRANESRQQRNYYEANKNNFAERHRKYREANREKETERQRKWAEANPERVAERSRKYYETNKEKVAERSRNWYKANPDKANVKTQNRRAKIKGNGGKLSADIVQTLLTKQNNKCACCGKSLKHGYHLDHVMPLALGGVNDDSNVQLLTPKCNLSKGAKHPDDWAKEKGIACL